MNTFNPSNYLSYSDLEPVCSKCFSDDGIVQFITNFNGSPGCSFCGYNDAPTAPLNNLCDHMRDCLLKFFSFALDHLPYDTREGGFQAEHWNTYELLFDELGLDQPRSQDSQLMYELSNRISDQDWCAYDWLTLDYDQALNYAWGEFCRKIQHERRFFFALSKENTDEDEVRFSPRDEFPPLRLLSEIVKLAEDYNLVQTLPIGTKFFRSRPCNSEAPYQTACQLGPPPPDKVLQSNRMNPPGIPMMYGAETEDIAVRESRSPSVTVGQFKLEREARILDLADLPTIPSIFSGVERHTRLGLIFIHAFARAIARPVDRDDRIHIEYIPSQVVTEFIRDSKIDGNVVHGIRYSSTLDAEGRNLVLFATQDDLMEPDGTPVSQKDYPPSNPWICLVEAHYVENTDNSTE